MKYSIAKKYHYMMMPIKLLITGLSKIWWNPSFKFDENKITDTGESLESKYSYALTMVDRKMDSIVDDGDGAKFLGMLYGATKKEEHWQILSQFFHPDGYFLRYPIFMEEKNKESDNFSGDMISGVLYAIWIRYKTGKMTNEEKSLLKKIWEKTCFEESELMFKHPYKSNEELDRGYLWRWFGVGLEALTACAFLDVGYQIFKDKRYKDISDELLEISGWSKYCYDYSIFMGKYYAASWYDEHSKMVIWATGYDCSNRKIYKSACKFLAKRYSFNPEILAFHNKYIEHNHDYSITIQKYLKNYDLRIKQEGALKMPNTWSYDYFSILSFFKKKPASKYILPMEYRSGKYLWEEKAIKNDLRARPGWYIDYISLYNNR